MTIDEVIEYWEGLRKTFSSQLEKEENHFGRMHLQTTIDALDTTISALRAQQSKGVEIDQVKNDPLTLDELRQMDGEPVWLNIAGGVWALVDTDDSVVWLNRGGSIDIIKIPGKAYRSRPEEGTE